MNQTGISPTQVEFHRSGDFSMSNRLRHESSPYLRQHAENPVDWYPWGDEALGRARQERRPIFLSIGYSACHWCHVMERESFEDPEIARLMNDHFVCIKVDREERPDLDQIYMTAVQIMTGRGGWPMSVFLTPEGQPFFGGTYWPPRARMQMPGFDQVLIAVRDAWRDRQALAIEQARQLTERLASIGWDSSGEFQLADAVLTRADAYLQRSFDSVHGGFGAAPKFPHAMDLQLLLRIWQRHGGEHRLQMVRLTLDKMAAGGIYDHLGGGFARYSVDDRWLVPHFEKMLYDNALLSNAYLDSYLATGEAEHATIVRETLDYVLREMTDSAGGFHSAEDADSEGEEGKFYVWTPREIQQVLGTEMARRFCEVFDVTEAGNFEGQNILNRPKTLAQMAALRNWPLDELRQQMDSARERLRVHRAGRVRPGKDDKVIVSWNGLMMDSLARAARALDDARYLQAADGVAQFIQDEMWRNDRLLHSWRGGQAHLAAYLDDYAALANGLVSLYEADFNESRLDFAIVLMDQVLQRFRDPNGGALFFTAQDHEQLITRTKDLQDNSVPSGNALAATALLRLAHLVQRSDYREAALEIIASAGGLLQQAPAAAGQMLMAADLALGPTYQIAIIGERQHKDCQEVLQDLGQRFLPRAVAACRNASPNDYRSPQLDALFEGRPALAPEPTCYVCQDFQCWPAVSGPAEARKMWDRLAQDAK
jgi:uncharacterized protein YyaL (SSP411 family)